MSADNPQKDDSKPSGHNWREARMRKGFYQIEELFEYALILVLVAIIVIVILALLGPSIGNVFSNVITNI